VIKCEAMKNTDRTEARMVILIKRSDGRSLRISIRKLAKTISPEIHRVREIKGRERESIIIFLWPIRRELESVGIKINERKVKKNKEVAVVAQEEVGLRKEMRGIDKIGKIKLNIFWRLGFGLTLIRLYGRLLLE
jgi:hypothetical protein